MRAVDRKQRESIWSGLMQKLKISYHHFLLFDLLSQSIYNVNETSHDRLELSNFYKMIGCALNRMIFFFLGIESIHKLTVNKLFAFIFQFFSLR